MLIDYIGYARISAKKAGLNIVLEEDDRPRTDGKTLFLPRPDAAWDDGQWLDWYYRLEHELGHERSPWREWKEVMQKYGIKGNTAMGAISNILSDHAQEYDRLEDGAGVVARLGKGRKRFIENTMQWGDRATPESEKMNALVMWDCMCRGDWNSYMHGVSMPSPTMQELEYIEALNKHCSPAYECKNEWEVYDLAKHVMEVLGFPEHEEKEETEGEGESAKKGKPCEEGEEGEGKRAGEVVDYDNWTMHSHEEMGEPRDLTYKGDTYKRTATYALRGVTVINLKKDKPPFSYGWGRTFKEASSSSSFSRQVRGMVQVLAQAHVQRGLRRGKLSPSKLQRVAMGDDRVFQRKVENDTIDTAVSLLIDFSGSMGGRRIEHAVESALLLLDALVPMGVKVRIAGFTDITTPIHYIVKDWDDYPTKSELLRRFSEASDCMYNNADGESVLFEYHNVIQQKQKKKIMIVLSDGYPASSGPYATDEMSFLGEVLGNIQKARLVHVYGIGIQSNAVEHFYKHRCVIDNTSDLEAKLLEVVKEKICG